MPSLVAMTVTTPIVLFTRVLSKSGMTMSIKAVKSGSDYDQDGDGLLSYHKDGLDCDDENAAVGSGSTWYVDRDGDRYGTVAHTVISAPSP